ncbi:uncharacterized protein TNIN_104001 [Trichonephila inaurata madagascariensis]|uniref:Mutator-like transposase domain-containing protein n=1 Tax=Trichonephila inaurata madagascariensis TaxID=2747483 RepID=A0A8X7C0R4_9ARAC|nr:uncharacterized protein TNIN_104001 [Trichonephila inaurata madagascariensis]
MSRWKRKNKSSKQSIQKRWCTETTTENNMDISEHNSNVAQHSCGDSIFKNERVSMQEKSVLEQENVADTYDGPSYIIVDKNALCDIFKYTFYGSCNWSTLKLEFGQKYGFSHQLKLVCKTCFEQKWNALHLQDLKKKSNISTPFDVNVRAVQAFLAISGGHASVENFCVFFNMPLMSVIWSKCSKETSAKSRRVNIAVFEAVSKYNFGTLKALKEIQKAANMDLGEQ